MTRYWVSLGTEDTDEYRRNFGLDEQEAQNVLYAILKLKELSNHSHCEDSVMVMEFVTEDLDEAKEVSAKARAIMEKHGWTEQDWLGVGVIATQPECPKCGYLARFSDIECYNCGSVLTWSEISES